MGGALSLEGGQRHDRRRTHSPGGGIMMADGHRTVVPAVELKGITKRFPGVVANHDIHLAVQPGTVHAIVGENGAGKSTLMKILYGMYRPDEGQILVGGAPVAFSSPHQAIRAG